MATDPRLNLSVFAQVNIGGVTPVTQPTDACSTTMGQNLFSVSSAETAAANITPGNVGAFANLQLGLGGGTVGAGLTGLASISDNIRLNGPPTVTNPMGLPASTDPNAGPEFVLQSVGLSSASLSSVAAVNSGVAASAQIQANTVFGQVQAGVFTNAMIPAAFSDFQNATALLSTLFQPGTGSSPPATNFGTMCGAKPYAIDLIALAPKYKFLFVVQFEFNPEFHEVLSNIDPAFVVKHSTRPNIKFDLEPVNFYNFRSAVAKKTQYEPMTMRFYDDDFNNIFQFYNAYLKLYSPIANVDVESARVDPLDAYENVGGGMGFNQPTQTIQPGWSSTVGQGYAGSLGPLGDSETVRNALRRISIFHVYKQGRMMNVYHFYNPKITQLSLDELDMASAGEGNEVHITFEYDSVYIIPGYRVLVNNTQYNLNAMTQDGVYPFGQIPGVISDDGNPRDGIGHGGGLGYGQDIVTANASSNTTANFVTIPSSIANFNPTLSTVSGTSLQSIAATVPSVGGGGNTMPTNLQATSDTDLPTVTVTASRIVDPVTGTTQDSANNSGNLGNVLGQTSNNTAAAITANSGTPSSLADSVGQQQNIQSAVSSQESDTAAPSTTFTGGGGSFGGGGASGSF